MHNGKICILIADDEVKMLKALKAFFTSKNYHILTAEDGKTVLDLFYENNEKIDLIILDIIMPFVSGIEVLSELRENKIKTPIILLTAKSEEYDLLEGFNTGADDYVTKPFSLLVLQARIETLLKRIYHIEDKVISFNEIKLNINTRQTFIDNTEVILTKKEFDLLSYLILNKEIVLPRDQILTAVWGYNFEGEIRTVDTHIKQLRMKLQNKDYIKTVHRVGYVFREDLCDEN